MRYGKFFLFWSIMLLFIDLLSAQINWDGRFYEQALVSFTEEKGKVKVLYLGLSALDLKLDARPSEILRIRSEMEYAFAHQDADPFLSSEGIDAVTVNSLNATISPGNLKFTIGRFLPAWGKGKVFRPLDIFVPQYYFLNSLSFRGTDGLSAKYYFSDLSSFELLAVPSFDVRPIMPSIDLSSNSPLTNAIDHTVVAANIELHIATFDNSLILLHDAGSGMNLIGLTFKGDAVLGLWSELSYSFDQKRKTALKASIGADYSFAKYYFLSAEFFYDETGLTDHKKYPLMMALVPRMTFGQQYLMTDFKIVTYTEVNFGITFIGNLLDKSFILFPYFMDEIISNCFLGLSLYHFNGKAGREFSPDLLGNYIFNSYLYVRF